MTRPPSPRLMIRVLNAVAQLCEAKGSSARVVLNYIQQTSKPRARNLTMQVHRALKHAVKAGLLYHRSGRYKASFTLNPTPTEATLKTNDEKKAVEDTSESDDEQSDNSNIVRRGQNSPDKPIKQRRGQKAKRSSNKEKGVKGAGNSRSTKKRTKTERNEGLKSRRGKYKRKEEKTRAPRNRYNENRIKGNIGNTSSNRARNKASQKESVTLYSDASDSNGIEIEVRSRKRKNLNSGRRNAEARYQSRGNSSRRSLSRNRSPQRQQQDDQNHQVQQQLQLQGSPSLMNIRMDSDDRQEDINIPEDQGIIESRELNNSGNSNGL